MIFKKLIKNRKLLAAIFLILSVQIFHYCADRKRSNPLDPKNQDTAGRLQNLRVYSESDRVYLSWKPVALENLRGYRIYRKTGDAKTYSAIQDIPADSSTFVDNNVTYNTRYTYQLTILGEDFETEPSDSVSIIPGPTAIWVGDVYDRQVFKLSHDCAHEIFHIPVNGYPWALALEKNQNRLWLTDVLFNEIVRINLADQEQVAIDRFYYGDPVAIKIDEKNGLVWVADEDSGVVHVYYTSGLKQKEIPGFQRISDIGCFFADGNCWVVDSGQKKLFAIRKNFYVSEAQLNLQAPFRLAVNQSSGELWLIDNGKVLKINALGKLLFEANYQFNDPYAVAVDSDNGRCWVLDWLNGANNSKVICLSPDGEKMWEKSGFSYPENIIVNPDDHGCVIADTGNGRVVKLTKDGEIFGEMNGFFFPYGLVIERER